jgi:L-alanine-DL-glutamate epimerase-like enolase superfamily enzyme
MAEYFPPPDKGGALDDDTLFWELFHGEPVAENGFICLSESPGLGLTLNEEQVQKWLYERQSGN